jgi:Heavy metal binding domain
MKPLLPDNGRNGQLPLGRGGQAWRQVKRALRLLQVRLRVPIVLVFAAVVVGRWDVIRNYWDMLTRGVSAESIALRAVSSDTEYFCPMDPGIVSDWPSKCGICNMALVRRKRGEAVSLPDGVIARMQISPYRIQLAGIQTAAAAFRPLYSELESSGVVARDKDGLIVSFELGVRQAPWVAKGQAAEISCTDLPGQAPLAGHVRSVTHDTLGGWECARIAVVFENPPSALSSGMFVVVRIQSPLAELDPFRSMPGANPKGQVLAVPRSAVVDSGTSKVVFVESMPGMFDGVEVVLGPRCGEYYSVVRGLEAGQKVATAGAFLLDAETRLNPALAASYFGANRGELASSAEPPKKTTNTASVATSALQSLAPEDRARAQRQKQCPVTNLPLGAMGVPIRMVVSDQVVFLCCDGCEDKMKREPAKYLAKLPRPTSP